MSPRYSTPWVGASAAAIAPMGGRGFPAMQALSTRNSEPERASRPFDADREGFVMGEGAGILILESLEYAERRDAPIRERVLTAIDGLLTDAPAGNIRRLTGITPPQWRLRVGDWRVRFNRDTETRTVLILRVLPRGSAYRG